MLQVTSQQFRPIHARGESAPADQAIGAGDLVQFVVRHARLIGLCTLIGLAVGVLYIALSRPIYVAQTQVFFDPKRPQPANGVTDFNLLQLDSAQLESQMQVVKSESISRHVVRELGLVSDPEFNTQPGSIARYMLLSPWHPSLSSGEPAADDAAPEIVALDHFAERLSVRRLGQSYVLEIAFWSESPGTAARVANSVTATYIRNQILDRLDAAQRGGEILETRIDDLRRQLATAEAAVRTGVIKLDSFPVADGRVITSASLPRGKSWPKSALVLTLAALAGLLVGGIGSGVRSAVDSRVRSRQQIENGLQATFLGSLPFVSRADRDKRSRRSTFAFSNPNSPFANDLRRLKTEIDIAISETKVQCIGVVSAFPREGRSTVACNLADAFFLAGRRVLLVDCDLRTRALSKSLAPSCEHGLVELLTGAAQAEDIELPVYSSGLPLLPIATRKHGPIFNDLLASCRMRQILQHFRRSYDLILVDLPPTELDADARAISPHLDAVVVVAEFDGTSIEALGGVISLFDRPPASLLGVVLNKVGK